MPVLEELYECAQTISQTDAGMQNLNKPLMSAVKKEIDISIKVKYQEVK